MEIRAGMVWRGWCRGGLGLEASGNSRRNTLGWRSSPPGRATWSPRCGEAQSRVGVRRERGVTSLDAAQARLLRRRERRRPIHRPGGIARPAHDSLCPKLHEAVEGRIRTIPSPRPSRCDQFDYTQCAITLTTLPGGAVSLLPTTGRPRPPIPTRSRPTPMPSPTRPPPSSPPIPCPAREHSTTPHPLTSPKTTNTPNNSHNPLPHNYLQQSRQSR